MIHDDGKIDYNSFSAKELQQARLTIKAEKYPKNFANLISEFQRRGIKPVEPEFERSTDPVDSDHMYSEQARSPVKARLTGLVTFVFGVIFFLQRYDDSVFYGRRGAEYTFNDNPVLFSFFLWVHGTIVLVGLLGMIFGSKFYRDLIKRKTSSWSLKKKR